MGRMTPWVQRLLIANVAMFFVQQSSPVVTELLAFMPALALQRPWSPVTYMFLHGGMMHLFFNMIVLFFFGPRLEQRLGERHFLGLYFVSGLTAALFSAFTPYAWVVGASGAIYGVMLAYARFWPRDRIYIWAILPVEARWMVVCLTGLALFGIARTLGGVSDGIAHHAHLGGFAGAWLYLRVLGQNSAAAKFKRKADPVPKKGWGHDRDAVQRWTRIDRESLHEVNREAFDAIMGKLATHGIGGLTDRERTFLDRFSGPPLGPDGSK